MSNRDLIYGDLDPKITPNVSGCVCVVQMFLFAIYATVGALCFNAALWLGWGVNVPWWLDVVGGIALGSLAVPVWLIFEIIHIAGVATPFFG